MELFDKSKWYKVRLETVTDYIGRGIAPSYVTSKGRTVLNQKCIRNNVVSFDDSRLTDEKTNIQKEKILKYGDILICSTGVGTLGRVAQIFDVNGDTTVDSHVSIVRPSSKIDSKFLGYYLKSKEKNIEAMAEGSTGQTELQREKLRSFEILIPEHDDVQNQIASLLCSLDTKIELLKKENKTLEELAQTIFKRWFVDFEFLDENGEPYKSSGGKMIESEIGLIPAGWKIYPLREIFTFIKGKKPQSISKQLIDGYLPQILIENLDGADPVFAIEKGSVICDEKSLLMVMDGASSGRVEFGFTGVVGSTLSFLKLLLPLRSILYLFLKYRESNIKEGTTGSAIPHTDKEKVYRFSMALPENFKYFDEIFETILYKINENRKSIKVTSSTKNVLINKIFN